MSAFKGTWKKGDQVGLPSGPIRNGKQFCSKWDVLSVMDDGKLFLGCGRRRMFVAPSCVISYSEVDAFGYTLREAGAL